jgi:6-pyruvoyltetrahydropterin/6-carboxytetrahydropterin synthase
LGDEMIEIFKEFTFEAAHQLAVNVPAGHPYSRVHGHSFTVQIFLKGDPDPTTHWLTDFAEIERQIKVLHEELDHRYLNDIEGLEIPTLENITRWIWKKTHNALPGLDRVLVRRGTCGEGCSYSGRAA